MAGLRAHDAKLQALASRDGAATDSDRLEGGR